MAATDVTLNNGIAPPTIYWGTGNLASFKGSSASTTPESAVLEALRLLQSHNITHIDTAQRYGEGKAEETLSKALDLLSSSSRNTTSPFSFTIDTKWAVPLDRAMTEDEILNSGKRSHSLLTSSTSESASKPPVIDTFYLHSPSPDTPLPLLLSTITNLHNQGLFTHFGISNFSAAQVRELHAFAVEHDYTRPTVYQGMYNAVHRDADTELLPTLRELGICFRAYSPVAGGFLAKTREEFEEGIKSGSGRFGGGLYKDTYVTEGMLGALERWGRVAEVEGVGRAELAVRWVVFHSGLDGGLGDGVLIGARDVVQLGETVDWIEKGKLSERAVIGVEEVWKLIRRGGVLGE